MSDETENQNPDENTGENASDAPQDAGKGTEKNADVKFSEIEGESNPIADAIGEHLDGPKDVEAIYDIPVQISAVLGRSSMKVSQLLKLGRGAVVELDRKVGEAIDIYVNNRLVARGEVVVNEDRLGVTMTEIVKADRSSS